MKVSVIGLGLMGGSFALALKQNDSVKMIYGVDKNKDHEAAAIKNKIVHTCVPLEEGILKSDVIIIATPVDAISYLLPQVLDLMSPEQLIVDLGSTKSYLCESVKNHALRGRYVAAHPMAGTENTGPLAAFSSLYEGAINVVCDQSYSDDSALKLALKLFNDVGMKTVFMDSGDHDKHVAYISHLSHISSFMLGLTVLNIERDEKNIANLAGSGFESTVRLAKSSPEMWAPIFAQNKKFVSKALAEYIDQLSAFKQMIDVEDSPGMSEAMEKANDIRRILLIH